MAPNQNAVKKSLSLNHQGLQRVLFYKTLTRHGIRIFTTVKRSQTAVFIINTRAKQTNPPVNRLITNRNRPETITINPAT